MVRFQIEGRLKVEPEVFEAFATKAADGVREPVQAIANDTVDALYTCRRKGLGELICNRRHNVIPSIREII